MILEIVKFLVAAVVVELQQFLVEGDRHLELNSDIVAVATLAVVATFAADAGETVIFVIVARQLLGLAGVVAVGFLG